MKAISKRVLFKNDHNLGNSEDSSFALHNQVLLKQQNKLGPQHLNLHSFCGPLNHLNIPGAFPTHFPLLSLIQKGLLVEISQDESYTSPRTSANFGAMQFSGLSSPDSCHESSLSELVPNKCAGGALLLNRQIMTRCQKVSHDFSQKCAVCPRGPPPKSNVILQSRPFFRPAAAPTGRRASGPAATTGRRWQISVLRADTTNSSQFPRRKVIIENGDRDKSEIDFAKRKRDLVPWVSTFHQKSLCPIDHAFYRDRRRRGRHFGFDR